jgi:thiamine biosynthesis lipoprotein
MMPSAKSNPAPYDFEAIGTRWRIEILQPLSSLQAAEVEQAVHARIEEFDRNYSRFRSDSLISAMAARAGRYDLPADAQPLFDLYHQLYRISDGAVTPLVGQLLSDAGYDATYSLRPGQLSAPPAWDNVLDYDFPHLTLQAPALLDLGAAGKGYLVDLVARLLEHHNIQHYCVNAGGDMAYRGPKGQALEVGLEHPSDPEQVIGVARLTDQSICGSAGNRRAWAQFNHIMDPRTQASPTHLQAVWVTAASTLLADALTTALYFVPAGILRQSFQFEYALVHADSSLEHSPGFPATFF